MARQWACKAVTARWGLLPVEPKFRGVVSPLHCLLNTSRHPSPTSFHKSIFLFFSFFLPNGYIMCWEAKSLRRTMYTRRFGLFPHIAHLFLFLQLNFWHFVIVAQFEAATDTFTRELCYCFISSMRWKNYPHCYPQDDSISTKMSFLDGNQHHLSTLSTKANRENDETDYSQRQIDNQNWSYRQ